MAQNQQRPGQIQLGIVGGGQLARMLALAAAPLAVDIHILSEKESDPASQVCRHWCKGDPNSRKDVMDFCENLDVLTFESEFYDMAPFFEAQQKSLQASKKTVPLVVYPNPEIMQVLQSRETQKAALVERKISTADYMEVSCKEDLDTAWSRFAKGFVLKKCRGGYDGFGTYYCRSLADLTKLGALFPGKFIAEELISFRRELAVTLVCGKDGGVVTLPLVESKQSQSRCDWVIGPVTHKKFAGLKKKLEAFVKGLNYVGSISFEMFDTGENLLINEIAPRVHNSAHYSQNALSHSQFLLHILAGLQRSLPEVTPISPAFCMVNLIGETHEPARIPMDVRGFLHWYGKTDNRPGRKMGHLNYIGTQSKTLLKLALQERRKFSL